jgi:hypothetical protein
MIQAVVAVPGQGGSHNLLIVCSISSVKAVFLNCFCYWRENAALFQERAPGGIIVVGFKKGALVEKACDNQGEFLRIAMWSGKGSTLYPGRLPK